MNKLKKMLLVSLTLGVMAAAVGCGSKSDSTEAAKSTETAKETGATTEAATADAGKEAAGDSYYFQKGDVKVVMGEPADATLQALGAAKNEYEAPSCAFDGMDKVYTYPGFEVLTYGKEGGEYKISGVIIRDDSVQTPEGIMIGSDIDAVEKAYGEVTDGANNLTVSKGNSELLIIFKDGVVSSIQYTAKE